MITALVIVAAFICSLVTSAALVLLYAKRLEKRDQLERAAAAEARRRARLRDFDDVAESALAAVDGFDWHARESELSGGAS